MSDAKYVRLDPSKMGFRYLGRVPPQRQQMLFDLFATLKKQMGKEWTSRLSAKEIFWLNIWQGEGDDDMMAVADPKLARTLDRWCRTAVRKYCEPGAIMDGYGFVVNPVGSKPQVWHVDYSTDCAAIWIPITPFTDKNATQFVTLPANTPKDLIEQVAQNVDEVDIDALARGVDHLLVQQIAARPMSVLLMGRGTIHRGVANAGKDHRVAFYISVHFIKDHAKNYPYPFAGFSEPSVVVFGTVGDQTDANSMLEVRK
jgi:hypothetical protein